MATPCPCPKLTSRRRMRGWSLTVARAGKPMVGLSHDRDALLGVKKPHAGPSAGALLIGDDNRNRRHEFLLSLEPTVRVC
jgi:hypothetical protein